MSQYLQTSNKYHLEVFRPRFYNKTQYQMWFMIRRDTCIHQICVGLTVELTLERVYPLAIAAKFMTVTGAVSPKRAMTKRPLKSSPGPSRSLTSTSNHASSVTVYSEQWTRASTESKPVNTRAAAIVTVEKKEETGHHSSVTWCLKSQTDQLFVL